MLKKEEEVLKVKNSIKLKEETNSSQKANHAVKNETPRLAPEQEALTAMQKQFGLINLDGKVFVFDRISLEGRTKQGSAAKLKLSPRQDGKLLIQRALKAQYPRVSAKKIVDTFWVSTQTVCYNGVEFNPKGASDNYLNLWVGPTITPQEGDWSLIKMFLLDIICSGDQEAYDYLIPLCVNVSETPTP